MADYNVTEVGAGRVAEPHLVTLARHWQERHGLRVDGLIGPRTRESLELSMLPGDQDTDRMFEPVGEPADQINDNPLAWLPFDGPLARLPRSRREVYETFGDPGTVARPSRSWRKQNIITVRDFPGVPPARYIKCHRLAEPYIREALRRAALVSRYEIGRFGIWNLRHIRQKPENPLSLHSWGIAVDINPPANHGKTYKRGEAPAPWSAEWRREWPAGIDRDFVMAVESVGFTWGGAWGRAGGDFARRARQVRYVDPMHCELRAR